MHLVVLSSQPRLSFITMYAAIMPLVIPLWSYQTSSYFFHLYTVFTLPFRFNIYPILNPPLSSLDISVIQNKNLYSSIF